MAIAGEAKHLVVHYWTGQGGREHTTDGQDTHNCPSAAYRTATAICVSAGTFQAGPDIGEEVVKCLGNSMQNIVARE